MKYLRHWRHLIIWKWIWEKFRLFLKRKYYRNHRGALIFSHFHAWLETRHQYFFKITLLEIISRDCIIEVIQTNVWIFWSNFYSLKIASNIFIAILNNVQFTGWQNMVNLIAKKQDFSDFMVYYPWFHSCKACHDHGKILAMASHESWMNLRGQNKKLKTKDIVF